MNIFIELIESFNPRQDGFVFMWVLALLAIAAFVLILERWLVAKKRLDVSSLKFIEKVKALIDGKRLEDAYHLCASGGRRALPRVIGAGIQRAMKTPELARSAMEEESLHMIPLLERRVQYILTFGNVSTLLGLMGTIYGLILSFAAVARPDIPAVEKSSMLASGISTAMNTTLFGLIISVPCIMIFSLLRARIDNAVVQIDRHAVSILKSLLPQDYVRKDYKISARRIKEEVDTEPNIAPMMNLMVILIPLLLTSAEFVKIGAIELKLPESSLDGGGGGGEAAQEIKLDLGIVITSRGFNLFHYFKSDSAAAKEEDEAPAKSTEIPHKNGGYDYEKLSEELAEVKRRILVRILGTRYPSLPENTDIVKLNARYIEMREQFAESRMFADHENVKIVAEDKIRYETVISVMDAARGILTPHGNVTMFPNVSLAGGIVQ